MLLYMFLNSEDYATSLLINKNLLANDENYKCHKCGSGVKYYTRLDRGKRRKVMRCKKKGCQTTQSIRYRKYVISMLQS